MLVDDDPFLPMPVNARQFQILRRVDTHAQTLVQGPPGTGKTHTAAALISHLLAQGKRVLVTAHTDRALKEVRAKLPAAIRPLAVSVVGSTREDMADLRTAVERIAATAADHEPADALGRMDRALRSIEDLRGRRAAAYDVLLAARQDEVQPHEFAGYRGTLASIARELTADADRYRWLTEYVDDVLDPPPLTSTEIVEWYSLVTDPVLAADETDARGPVLELAVLPDPRRFAELVAAEADAASADSLMQHRRAHPAAAAVERLPAAVRDALRVRLHSLVSEIDYLSSRQEQWIAAALHDVRSRRADLWRARYDQISNLVGGAMPLVRSLGPITEVELRSSDIGGLIPLARDLHEYLSGGRTIKVGPDGRPKIGALAPKPVRRAAPLFEAVLVDGFPPTTLAQLKAFLSWMEATKTLNAGTSPRSLSSAGCSRSPPSSGARNSGLPNSACRFPTGATAVPFAPMLGSSRLPRRPTRWPRRADHSTTCSGGSPPRQAGPRQSQPCVRCWRGYVAATTSATRPTSGGSNG